jgi:superfamily II DNA or RNA helicase
MLEKIWKFFGAAQNVKQVSVSPQSYSRSYHQPETIQYFPEAEDSNFFVVNKKYLTEKDLNKYRQQLVAISKYDDNKQVAMYGETDTVFAFPRYFFSNRQDRVGNKIKDNTTSGEAICFKSNIKLWDYQQKAIDEFTYHQTRGKTGFFLGAAPGAGKTQMGIKMMEILGKNTLIIVPKKDLIDQWVERILATTDIARSDIGICQSGKIDYLDKKVVVGVVHTIVKFKRQRDFQENFGTIIFDECDSSVPPATFAPCASMFTAKYRIGMTASETREDGLDIIFRNHISEVKIVCEKSNTMTPEILAMHYYRSSGELPFSKDIIARKGMLLSLLAENEHRNDAIARMTRDIAITGNFPTVVMSDRKEQLKKIYNILTNTYKVSPSSIGYYVGTLNNGRDRKEENKQVAQNSKIILATYGQMSRGTDIPRLNAIILATPRNDLRQVVGRIERANPGKATPLVVDFIDESYSLAQSGGKKRKEYYKGRGLVVHDRELVNG